LTTEPAPRTDMTPISHTEQRQPISRAFSESVRRAGTRESSNAQPPRSTGAVNQAGNHQEDPVTVKIPSSASVDDGQARLIRTPIHGLSCQEVGLKSRFSHNPTGQGTDANVGIGTVTGVIPIPHTYTSHDHVTPSGSRSAKMCVPFNDPRQRQHGRSCWLFAQDPRAHHAQVRSNA
jgi:hypothetical protein